MLSNGRDGSAEHFTRMGTLGIEEEFYVVDEFGRPTSGTDELVYGRSRRRFLTGGSTTNCSSALSRRRRRYRDPANAGDNLRSVRDALVDHAEATRVRYRRSRACTRWRSGANSNTPRNRATSHSSTVFSTRNTETRRRVCTSTSA